MYISINCFDVTIKSIKCNAPKQCFSQPFPCKDLACSYISHNGMLHENDWGDDSFVMIYYALTIPLQKYGLLYRMICWKPAMPARNASKTCSTYCFNTSGRCALYCEAGE